MTIKQTPDFSKAPEGATHYSKNMWLKLKGTHCADDPMHWSHDDQAWYRFMYISSDVVKILVMANPIPHEEKTEMLPPLLENVTIPTPPVFETVVLSADNVRHLLQALLGAPHEIRELQVLAKSSLPGSNPIRVLVEQYNEQAVAFNETLKEFNRGVTE